MNQTLKIFLIKLNRYIFGTLLHFTFWELKAFEQLVQGKEKTIYDYIDIKKHKYNWKTGGL